MSDVPSYQAVDSKTGEVQPVMAVAVPIGGPTMSEPIKPQEPETKIRVIAPSNLAAGYHLHVQVNGQPSVVVVVC